VPGASAQDGVGRNGARAADARGDSAWRPSRPGAGRDACLGARQACVARSTAVLSAGGRARCHRCPVGRNAHRAPVIGRPSPPAPPPWGRRIAAPSDRTSAFALPAGGPGGRARVNAEHL